jgi:hypothetical protein
MYPDRKYAFRQIRRRPMPPKPPSDCWRNSCLRRIGRHITGLEFSRLFYMRRFAGESQGYASVKSGHSTSVCRRGIEPASDSIYLQNMCLIPSLPLSRRQEK